MRLFVFIAALLAFPVQAQAQAQAQTTRDAATTLGRDVVSQPDVRERPDTGLRTVLATPGETVSAGQGGLFVGAVNIEGARAIPLADFAAIIEPFVGKTASADDLQALARAIADAARARGYIFASAIVPEQVVDTGTVTVRLDEGAVDRVMITGSDNRKLKAILTQIAGPAVRRETFERQLLLASDIPGMSVYSTRYVRAADGAALFVDVSEKRVSGSAGIDNFGSRELGPARLRLRLDLTGLLDDGDQLVTQLVVAPLQPKELAFGSVRYTIGVGTAGTQIGVAASAGRTKPGGSLIAGRLSGNSVYAAAFVNHAVIRSARTSLWVNSELAHLRVDQTFEGRPAQKDEITSLTLSLLASTKFAGSRLWGGVGVVQGLDGTRRGDRMASRRDGTSQFTKAVFWLNWTGNLTRQLSLRVAGNAQIANRPLLAAQEIGVGGPGFGRGYDFSERFGDSGALGLVELRQQFDNLLPGVNWVQIYQFADGGYVENMTGGFGDGARWSAGAGLRALIGKTNVGVELAFPLNAPREEDATYAPRINLSVGHDF